MIPIITLLGLDALCHYVFAVFQNLILIDKITYLLRIIGYVHLLLKPEMLILNLLVFCLP